MIALVFSLIIVLSDDTEPLADNSGTIVSVLVVVSLGSLAVFAAYVFGGSSP